MRLIKFTTCMLFICCIKAESATNITIIDKEPSDILQLLETDKDVENNHSSNGNSLEDDITEVLKELNLLPANFTSTPEPVSIPKESWNITKDFPSNEEIEKHLSTTTPSYSIIQSDEYKPPITYTESSTPEIPSWVPVVENLPINNSGPSAQTESPFIINNALQNHNSNPTPENNHIQQHSSWINKGSNSFNQLPNEKHYQSSNYYSSLQSHGVQTFSNQESQPSNHNPQLSTPNHQPSHSISQSYLPIPFIHPQNSLPWIQPHCSCQNYYNPFSSYTNYPNPSYVFSNPFPQHHEQDIKDTTKYKSEYVSSYNNGKTPNKY